MLSGFDLESSRYIAKVRAIPRLSRDEEHALAVRARKGDREAADALVEANLRYSVAVAIQYRRYGIPVSELIAEGNLGLMMAIRKFDPDRGTRFVTYAGYWIRAYVLNCVVRSTTLVGGGAGALRSKMYFRLRRERARLANVEPDPTELNRRLAEHFGVSPEKMASMTRRIDNKDLSLDQPSSAESQSTWMDLLISPDRRQDEEYIDRRDREELQSELTGALGELDQRERFIVERRFLGEEEMSLAAIGRLLGVSRERARQLEARAKKKLKARLEGLSVLAFA